MFNWFKNIESGKKVHMADVVVEDDINKKRKSRETNANYKNFNRDFA